MKDNETNLNAGINHLLYRTEYSSANTDSICSGRGDLWFRGNLHIDGIFSGKLNVCGCLTVGKNAHITGEVEINDLILSFILLLHFQEQCPRVKLSSGAAARSVENGA
jgi:hypothetical protein